jgi:hypothetical protein
MYRIKHILGSLVAVFSLVYLVFGIIGWIDERVTYTNLMICFVLASAHLGGGGWLIMAGLRDQRRERSRVDQSIRMLIRQNAGRLSASELSRLAKISANEAREYLDKRAKYDVSVVLQSKEGEDVYFFGQQFWNN